ncbi:MAG: DUF4440 domain-containing protein [Silicimonas sp.]|nr:DUF4440 domain-containing protein [Silicimonas sp.]
MTADETDALDAISTMTSAFMAGDIEAVMNVYEDHASVAFEPGQPVSDAAVLAEMFTAMSALKPQFTYSGHEVIVQGDLALHIAPWSMTGTTPDGQDVAQSGLSVAILRKQADGGWKMVIDNPHGARLIEAR